MGSASTKHVFCLLSPFFQDKNPFFFFSTTYLQCACIRSDIALLSGERALFWTPTIDEFHLFRFHASFKHLMRSLAEEDGSSIVASTAFLFKITTGKVCVSNV